MVAGFVGLEMALAVWGFARGTDTDDEPCPEESAAVRPVGAVAEPADLEIIGGQDPTVRMGRELGTRTKTISFKVASGTVPNGAPLATEVLTFERDDGAQLGRREVTATASVVRGQARLRLCVDRTRAGAIDPGTYKGTVRIIDERVMPADLVMTVELAYPAWPIIAAWGLLFGAGATVWVWFLRHQNPGGGEPQDLAAWLTTWRGAVAIGAGLAGATLSWAATYLNDGTWGASIYQWLTLGGVCFTAFTTAATAAAVVPGGGRRTETPAAHR